MNNKGVNDTQAAGSNEGPSASGKMVRTFGSLALAKILGDVATFALFIVISRVFGQEGIGEYSFAIALTGMFAILSEFGTGLFTIREVSHSTEPFAKLFGRVLSLRLLLVSSVALLLLGVLFVLPFPRETVAIVAVIGGYQLLYQLIAGFGAAFIATERPVVAGALEVSFRAVAGSAAISVALLSRSLLLTVCVLLIAAFTTAVVAYGLVRAWLGRPRLTGRLSVLARTGREVIPYGLSDVFETMRQRLDVTLVGLLLGTVAAGAYNVAYRPVFMLWFIPYFFSISVLPVASRLHASSSGKLHQLYARSLNLGVLLGLPVSAGLALLAPDIILLVFGDDFLDSIPLLRILAWLLFLVFVRFLLAAFLTACGRQAERTRAQGWALLAAFLLFLILIPTFGTYGAAIAALLAEAALIVMLVSYLLPVLGRPRVGSRLLIAGSAVAAFVSLFTLLPAVPWPGVVVGSIFIYSAILAMFRRIRDEELALAIRLLRNRRQQTNGRIPV